MSIVDQTLELEFRRRERTRRLNELDRNLPPRRQVNLGVLRLVLKQGVFPADKGEGTQLLMGALPGNLAGARVWDLGTGSGVIAALAAKRAATVLATDILDSAVRLAIENAELNLVRDRVDVKQGSLFEPLDDDDKFDLIAFNPPFMPGRPLTAIDVALHDPDHTALLTFIEGAAVRLRRGGKILLAFSDLGDQSRVQQAIGRAGFSLKTLNSMAAEDGEFYIWELTLPTKR